MREGITRVRVLVHGKRTSVSLDSVLHGMLSTVLGGAEPVDRWVQTEVLSILDLEQRGITAGARDVKACLSRLVQRQAFRLLFAARDQNALIPSEA